MMIIDKILEWARERGYTAVYGSSEQVNEMLNNTPFADSKDGTTVVMHLITDSATVDGKDRAVVAVYFASLCPFDFDGEALLLEQERLKGVGKELLNSIRTGNEMTYADPRWQYGYDDYAENVCWVCLRVTLTASAADCVPLSPEPPTPPPTYLYDIFCPQIAFNSDPENVVGRVNPLYKGGKHYICIVDDGSGEFKLANHVPWIGTRQTSIGGQSIGISNRNLNANAIIVMKNVMERTGRPMTEETEQWLTERIGKKLYYITISGISSDETPVLAATGATHFEYKDVTVI